MPTSDRSSESGAAPITVIHVITDLDVGGAERMLATYLTGPRDPDVRHVVVSLKPPSGFADEIAAAGVEVFSLNLRSWPNPLALWRLVRLLRQMRPDVVQTWMYHADLLATLALVLSGRRRQTALAWGIRCSDMDLSAYSPMLRFVVTACRLLSHLPDVITANSEAGQRVHRNDLGYRGSDWRVVPNSIDTERFRPDPEARAAVRAELGITPEALLIGVFARVDPMKDYPTYLAALERLPHVTGLAVGKDTDTALPARPNLIRLGRRQDVARLYAACDATVLPSAFGEGFPNVVAESMACGVPVAATDVGDARAIVADIGRSVPPRDPAALAAAVEDLLGQPPQARAAVADRARRRVLDNYTAAAGAGAAGFDALFRELSGEVPAQRQARRARGLHAALQPFLAIGSALVSRLSLFVILIVAARLLSPEEFGAFAVISVFASIVNALSSGGGDMWLNPFTRRGRSAAGEAPRIWATYLCLCVATGSLVSGIAVTLLLAYGKYAGGLGLGALEGYHASAIIGIAAGMAAGLMEAMLAILRSSNRVASFFLIRDLAVPVALLALFLVLQPPSAFDAVLLQFLVSAASLAAVLVLLIANRSILPRPGIPKLLARRRVLAHTMSLIYGNLGSRLAVYVDVLVLTYIVSLAELGQYRAAAQFAIGFLVVQHFVFLTLPWQLRRQARVSGGPRDSSVRTRQRMLIELAMIAAVTLILLADSIMQLLGDRFTAATPIFQFYVAIRAIGLLWGPNHELLISNGRADLDAHVNVIAIGVWLAVFWIGYQFALPALSAAVVAGAIGALAGHACRFAFVLRADLQPELGHGLGPALPAGLTLLLAGAAIWFI